MLVIWRGGGEGKGRLSREYMLMALQGRLADEEGVIGHALLILWLLTLDKK